MNIGEFYRSNHFAILRPDGGIAAEYIGVIKLTSTIPAGQGDFPIEEDGFDYVFLISNSCLAAAYSPIGTSELEKCWHKISKEEVVRLGEAERDIEPSLWNHELFLKTVED